MPKPPKVFISYSHDDEPHKRWVRELATHLRKNGIDAILDQWDLSLGSDLAKFMEHGLSQSDRVLVVSTDNYIAKADSGRGGVGYEKMIATAELLAAQDTTKFIPVVRNVTSLKKLPVFLCSKFYIDLSPGVDSDAQRAELLRELHNAREAKPPLGANPYSESDIKVETNSEESRESSKPMLNGTESTVFFSDRFSSAFPGVQGIAWFDDQENIGMRLGKLLRDPLDFRDGSPIWWWRDGNLRIHSFQSFGEGLYLMDWYEYRITKIAAVNRGAYYQKFIYVETEAMEPTGLYPDVSERIKSWVDKYGYCSEEYGLFNGKYKVNRAEYDDNAACIDGELVELGSDVELRVRYITPYNFLIAAHQSPINNNQFDLKLRGLLKSVLMGTGRLEGLTEEVLKLPKREMHRI